MNMIEKVAREIAGHYCAGFDSSPKNRIELKRLHRLGDADINDPTQDDHLNAAKAAIEAMREPSNGMINAAHIFKWNDVERNLKNDRFRVSDLDSIYTAMINKALEEQ